MGVQNRYIQNIIAMKVALEANVWFVLNRFGAAWLYSGYCIFTNRTIGNIQISWVVLFLFLHDTGLFLTNIFNWLAAKIWSIAKTDLTCLSAQSGYFLGSVSLITLFIIWSLFCLVNIAPFIVAWIKRLEHLVYWHWHSNSFAFRQRTHTLLCSFFTQRVEDDELLWVCCL